MTWHCVYAAQTPDGRKRACVLGSCSADKRPEPVRVIQRGLDGSEVLRGSYTWHATLAQARQAAKEAEI